MDLKKEELELARTARKKAEEAEERKGRAAFNAKYSTLLSQVDELEDDLTKVASTVGNISDLDDRTIRTTMKSVPNWKERKMEILKEQAELRAIVRKHGGDPTCVEDADERVDKIEEMVTNFAAAVEHEDKERNLYSLDT